MARCVRVSLHLKGFQGLLYKPCCKTNATSEARVMARRRYWPRLRRPKRTAATCIPLGASYSRTWMGNGYINPHWVAQIRDLQLQFRIQCRRARLPRFQILELKTQIDAAKVLKNVKKKKHGHDSAEPGRLVQVLLFGWLHVTHQ